MKDNGYIQISWPNWSRICLVAGIIFGFFVGWNAALAWPR